MTRGRATRDGGIVRWLLPASVLHVVVVLVAAAFDRGAAPTLWRAAAAPDSVEPESILELTLLDDDEWRAMRASAAHSAPLEAAPRTLASTGSQPRRAGIGGSRQAAARVAATRASLEQGAPPEATADANEPPHDTPPREAAPTLSLDQLGIGTNPFLAIAIEPLSKEEQANTRLQAALQPAQANHDRLRGRSPEGPVVEAARRLVLAEDGLVEASVVLNVRVDGGGHVTEVRVLEASSQIKAWQMLAARLAQALNPITLPGAGSSQGWGMKLRLASSVQLPSGATPGLRIGTLGQQVAGSGGPGSTSLELSPTSKLDIKEPIDSVGRHLDSPMRFEAVLLKLKADLADISAPARRVVVVAVLSIDPSAAP